MPVPQQSSFFSFSIFAFYTNRMNARNNAFLSVLLTFAIGSWIWSACSYLFLDFLKLTPSFGWGTVLISTANEAQWTRTNAFLYFLLALMGLPVLDLLMGLLGKDVRQTNHPLRPVLVYFRVLAWSWPGAFLGSAWNRGGDVSDLLNGLGVGPKFSVVFLGLGFLMSMLAGIMLGKEVLQLSNSASSLQTHVGKARFAVRYQVVPFLILAIVAYYLGGRNKDHLFFWWAGFTALGTLANAIALSFGIVAAPPSVYKNSAFYKMDYRLLVFGVASLGSFVLLFFKFI